MCLSVPAATASAFEPLSQSPLSILKNPRTSNSCSNASPSTPVVARVESFKSLTPPPPPLRPQCIPSSIKFDECSIFLLKRETLIDDTNKAVSTVSSRLFMNMPLMPFVRLHQRPMPKSIASERVECFNMNDLPILPLLCQNTQEISLQKDSKKCDRKRTHQDSRLDLKENKKRASDSHDGAH